MDGEDDSVGTDAIIAAIDKELVRLREVRGLLAQEGRTAGKDAGQKRAKHRLSPAARARIAEAQRKRWAAARKRTKK